MSGCSDIPEEHLEGSSWPHSEKSHVQSWMYCLEMKGLAKPTYLICKMEIYYYRFIVHLEATLHYAVFNCVKIKSNRP